MWGKAGYMGIENKVWHTELLRHEVKSQQSQGMQPIGLLACVTSSELWPPENHHNPLYVPHKGYWILYTRYAILVVTWLQLTTQLSDGVLYQCHNRCALVRVNKTGNTMVYLTQALEENSLCIERFHRGSYLIGRQFEEIAFCSKDTFNTVERQLIQNVALHHGGQ